MKTTFYSLIIILSITFFSCDKDKPTSCIDKSLIDLDAPYTADDTKVCGCDGLTYSNGHKATVRHGVTSYTMGPCEVVDTIDTVVEIPKDCIDSTVIDWDKLTEFTTDGTNVCGCNGKTYYNSQIAYHKYGVTKYEYGACPDAPKPVLK